VDYLIGATSRSLIDAVSGQGLDDLFGEPFGLGVANAQADRWPQAERPDHGSRQASGTIAYHSFNEQKLLMECVSTGQAPVPTAKAARWLLFSQTAE
jgi:hypothetical protein